MHNLIIITAVRFSVISTRWFGMLEVLNRLNSNTHSFPGLKASLERLQLEYVDVVFANRPDPNTPMEGKTSSFQPTLVFSIPPKFPRHHLM